MRRWKSLAAALLAVACLGTLGYYLNIGYGICRSNTGLLIREHQTLYPGFPVGHAT